MMRKERDGKEGEKKKKMKMMKGIVSDNSP